MYEVSSELYDEIARQLLAAFGANDYFSGSVVCRAGEVECRLTASLILYRRSDHWPDGVHMQMVEVVPVWWEFHTVTPAGEVANDFTFAELKPALLV